MAGLHLFSKVIAECVQSLHTEANKSRTFIPQWNPPEEKLLIILNWFFSLCKSIPYSLLSCMHYYFVLCCFANRNYLFNKCVRFIFKKRLYGKVPKTHWGGCPEPQVGPPPSLGAYDYTPPSFVVECLYPPIRKNAYAFCDIFYMSYE